MLRFEQAELKSNSNSNEMFSNDSILYFGYDYHSHGAGARAFLIIGKRRRWRCKARHFSRWAA